MQQEFRKGSGQGRERVVGILEHRPLVNMASLARGGSITEIE